MLGIFVHQQEGETAGSIDDTRLVPPSVPAREQRGERLEEKRQREAEIHRRLEERAASSAPSLQADTQMGRIADPVLSAPMTGKPVRATMLESRSPSRRLRSTIVIAPLVVVALGVALTLDYSIRGPASPPTATPPQTAATRTAPSATTSVPMDRVPSSPTKRAPAVLEPPPATPPPAAALGRAPETPYAAWNSTQLDRQDCQREAELHSLPSTTRVTLRFDNRRSTPVRVYWLDFAGKRVLYTTLAAGQTMYQPTFSSHRWMVTTEGDECLGVYEPVGGPSIAEIR